MMTAQEAKGIANSRKDKRLGSEFYKLSEEIKSAAEEGRFNLATCITYGYEKEAVKLLEEHGFYVSLSHLDPTQQLVGLIIRW